MSSQGIKEKLQSELDELETELRIHLPKEIKRAVTRWRPDDLRT